MANVESETSSDKEDVNDPDIVELADFSACPADAQRQVRKTDVTLERKEGDAPFREWADGGFSLNQARLLF